MIDFAIFVAAIVTILGLVFYSAKLKIDKRKTFNGILQLAVDKDALTKELAEAKMEIQKLSSPDDGFVKFLSESRVWAYEYIESAQKEIQEIVSAIDAEKTLLSETKPIRKAELEDILNRIIKHSDRLKAILPEDN
jgi:cell division protein FtsL